MDNSSESTNGEDPLNPKTGTVQDVRPRPPLDPKALAPSQVGYLKDKSTHERKSFKANLSRPLDLDEDVIYKDLPKPASHDAEVTGRP